MNRVGVRARCFYLLPIAMIKQPKLTWGEHSLFGLCPRSKSITEERQGRNLSKAGTRVEATKECCLLPCGLASPSLLFSTTQDHLPWGGTTRTELGSPMSVTNQEAPSSTRTSLQTDMKKAFLSWDSFFPYTARLCQAEYTKLSEL